MAFEVVDCTLRRVEPHRHNKPHSNKSRIPKPIQGSHIDGSKTYISSGGSTRTKNVTVSNSTKSQMNLTPQDNQTPKHLSQHMADMYELREAYKNGVTYELKRGNSSEPDPSPFFELFRKEKDYDYCGVTPQDAYQFEDEYDDCNLKASQPKSHNSATLSFRFKASVHGESKMKEARGTNGPNGHDSDGFVIV